MKLNTASTAITFSRQLEDGSAALYRTIAQRFTKVSDVFDGLAAENQRFKEQVDRAYYGVISDALEGAFSFEGIDTDDFLIPDQLARDSTLTEAIQVAISTEKTIAAYYEAAVEASKSLMADVPRVLAIIAQKKHRRIDALTLMLDQAG